MADLIQRTIYELMRQDAISDVEYPAGDYDHKGVGRVVRHVADWIREQFTAATEHTCLCVAKQAILVKAKGAYAGGAE